jgi:hypothetical protein
MEANELRIGNYVNSKAKTLIIVSGWELYNMTVRENRNGNIFIEPIPLTEEWLLKFGLKKDTQINGYDMEIYFHKNKWGLNIAECPNESAGFWVELKHVHQLQNLYFALTGEELLTKKQK